MGTLSIWTKYLNVIILLFIYSNFIFHLCEFGLNECLIRYCEFLSIWCMCIDGFLLHVHECKIVLPNCLENETNLLPTHDKSGTLNPISFACLSILIQDALRHLILMYIFFRITMRKLKNYDAKCKDTGWNSATEITTSTGCLPTVNN